MPRKIFFDLDGTLVDCSERIYQLFRKLEPRYTSSKEIYWEERKVLENQKEFLEKHFDYKIENILEFRERWMTFIESLEFIMMDKPLECATELLEKLHKDNELYVITARQKISTTMEQMKQFGWDKFFKKVLVTEQKTDKASLIAANCKVEPTDVIVGDIGEDIVYGKTLGIRTVAVTSGFRSEEVLRTFEPDILVSGVKEIYENNLL